jgi:phosphatidylglycerol---prolipoprotein diacylglyceryl transferase
MFNYPTLLEIGPFKIHWYGMMYIFAFLLAWILGRYRATHYPFLNFKKEEVGDLIFYAALGTIIGGRLGDMLFYQLPTLIASPLTVFKIWQGGMSFHGGILGVMAASFLFAYKTKRHFFELSDFLAPLVPLGLFLGRIGNFVNGELWGRVTNLPWGMVFPLADRLPRHPSQLYEAFLEGIVLFVLLWWYGSKPRPRSYVSAFFLIGYGVFRSLCEFFREPDLQLGFIALGWVTMGQILSFIMILAGIIIFVWRYLNIKKRIS